MRYIYVSYPTQSDIFFRMSLVCLLCRCLVHVRLHRAVRKADLYSSPFAFGPSTHHTRIYYLHYPLLLRLYSIHARRPAQHREHVPPCVTRQAPQHASRRHGDARQL